MCKNLKTVWASKTPQTVIRLAQEHGTDIKQEAFLIKWHFNIDQMGIEEIQMERRLILRQLFGPKDTENRIDKLT